jgi:H+/gluconate symporter-like permease
MMLVITTFFGFILVVRLTTIRFSYFQIIFAISVSFCQALDTGTDAEIRIREEEAVGNVFQSISLPLCYTAAASGDTISVTKK